MQKITFKKFYKHFTLDISNIAAFIFTTIFTISGTIACFYFDDYDGSPTWQYCFLFFGLYTIILGLLIGSTIKELKE